MSELWPHLNFSILSSLKGIYVEAIPVCILSRYIQDSVACCCITLCNWTHFLLFCRQSPAYSTLPPEGVFTNTFGLLVLVFGALIFWIVTRPQWKRPKEPNSVLLHPNGGAPEGAEGTMAVNFGNMDKSDSELNSEAAARKRNFALDEAGQRSTM